MIGVAGQYVFDILTVDEDVVILPEEEHVLKSFVMHQYGGNMLPTFKMNFLVNDDRTVRYLNEGDPLILWIGKDKDDILTTDMFITQVDIQQYGEGQKNVTMEGMLDKPDYVSKTRYGITSEVTSSFKTAVKVLDPYFNIDTNIENSIDRQVWIQPTITDRQFVTYLLQHCNLFGSFPVFSIAAFDNMCRILDAKKLFETVDWDLGWEGDLPIPGNVYRIVSGGYNQMVGYTMKQRVVNEDMGEETGTDDRIVEVSPLFSESPFNRHASVDEPRLGKLYIQNKNHDRDYHLTRLQNQTYGALASMFKINLTFNDFFRNFRPYDVAKFLDGSIEQEKLIEESLSGKFLIEHVTHRIQQERFSSTITVTRESPNGIIGEFS